ncbi:hypothetical protein CKAN_01749100 [Cinnamomum micranthum f. kanehirae]|uniref:DUF659 domain-containing protein n=1 Tax=Cinnamomum micranthum f. kanehirae TaxID=337451 RepID=A0A3S3QRG2_9MAGN|nr:hypothetical protein CKAN_01749100 [Cinnamomum micranthum f. kanehirae]
MPHIVWVPRAAHCIDLVLEDIGKLEDVQKTIDEGKMGSKLLRPGITRFATHFVALERLCHAKANIMQIWTSGAYVNAYFSHQPLSRRVHKIALGTDLWYGAKHITYLLEPLVMVLKLVDADSKPTMVYVYDAVDRAKLAIEQISREKYRPYYRKLWKKLLIIDGTANYLKKYEWQLRNYKGALGSSGSDICRMAHPRMDPEDDPLDEWLAERENAVLPNTDFLNESMIDVDE